MNKRMEKKQNLIRIITMFRRHGGLTQARLKEFTGLQASTVSYLVGDLKRSGILLDNGQEQWESPALPWRSTLISPLCWAFTLRTTESWFTASVWTASPSTPKRSP